jgi:GNAT superfamily N-acetyltransferase
MADELVIEDALLTSSDARTLIARLNAELDERYPEPGANFFRLDPNEVGPGRGAFVVGRLGGIAVACGGVRLCEEMTPRTAEVKRMFVDPAARGRGVARQVLAALKERARSLGARRLVLETGARQPEALALYRRAGFLPIEPFGEYVGSAQSVCMAVDLDPEG